METNLKSAGQVAYSGLQHQPGRKGHLGPLLQNVRKFLRAQFGRPTGIWGHVVGGIMARTPSNLERSQWTIGLLDLKPTDRVLEIGFGPGLAIEAASRMVTQGVIMGVDHSPVMLAQAKKRNSRAVDEGRVELLLGSALDLPVFQQPFDTVFTINSIHFWTEPTECLRRLCGALKPGGLIAVTIQPRSIGTTDSHVRQIGEELVKKLRAAGFVNCRLELHHIPPAYVACALGNRP